MKHILREFITQDTGNIVVEAKEDFDQDGNSRGKSLYMKGICIQGGVRNANQRVYPVNEISRAVTSLNEQIKNGYSIYGELDHPEGLNINLDRVSHMITEMWMDTSNGYGKMKILPTAMGEIVKTLLSNGGKLGVSSRGSGNVSEDGSGNVSDFEIVTVDIVAQPSAPGAYPTPIYEHLMNTTGGYRSINLANEAINDPLAQKYLKESLINIINQLQ